MQSVLMSKSHGSMNLMHLLCNNSHRFANTRLTCRHFCNKSVGAQRIYTRICRTLSRSNFCGNYRQAMLYCLKLADRAPELFTLSGKLQA